MKVIEPLRRTDIGNSVAEFDTHLQHYFLETQIYSDFVSGRYDIVSGDKGTGKTAIYRIVRDKYREIPELHDVELLSGFNDSGNPIFQRLTQADVLTEGQYITVWKTYLLSLVGNFVLDICEGEFSDGVDRLNRLLNAIDLRTKDPTASTVFSQLANLLRRLAHPKSAEIAMSVTDVGMPVVVPRIEFGDIPHTAGATSDVINNDDALHILDSAVEELGGCPRITCEFS